MVSEINPFDIASGKVVQNKYGTFWFKEPGHNVDEFGWPIPENFHNLNGPAVIWSDKIVSKAIPHFYKEQYFINGIHYGEAGFLREIKKYTER